jgi:hypothetical protein
MRKTGAPVVPKPCCIQVIEDAIARAVAPAATGKLRWPNRKGAGGLQAINGS